MKQSKKFLSEVLHACNTSHFFHNQKRFSKMKKATIIAVVALCFLATGIIAQTSHNTSTINEKQAITENHSPLMGFTQEELKNVPYVIEVHSGKNWEKSYFVDGKSFDRVTSFDATLYQKISPVKISFDEKTQRSKDFSISVNRNGDINNFYYDEINKKTIPATFEYFFDTFNWLSFDLGTNFYLSKFEDSVKTSSDCFIDSEHNNMIIAHNIMGNKDTVLFKADDFCERTGIEAYWVPKDFLLKNPKFKKLSEDFSFAESLLNGCIHPAQVGWERRAHSKKLYLPFVTNAQVSRENETRTPSVENCNIPIGVCDDGTDHNRVRDPHGWPATDFAAIVPAKQILDFFQPQLLIKKHDII